MSTDTCLKTKTLQYWFNSFTESACSEMYLSKNIFIWPLMKQYICWKFLKKLKVVTD